MLNQEQLDEIIRKAKGKRAVEEMLEDSAVYQRYSLSDGCIIRVNKETGAVEEANRMIRKGNKTIVSNKWIFLDPIAKAKARVKAAQDELTAAGKELLDAIHATEDEIADAVEGLVDIHHEADADGWAGAEWNQMLADTILSYREDAARSDEEDK